MNYTFPAMGGCGHLEVVCGPMFSGKTEELIRRIRRAQIARQKIQLFKPSIDDRYSKEKVVSHSGQALLTCPIEKAREIFQNLHDDTRVIGIDEVQFFDEEIIEVISKLVRRGLRVICAGLDLDSMGRPFGTMPYLLALADSVSKIQAICTVCGMPATKSQRLLRNSKSQVLVGDQSSYEARCGNHFEVEVEASDLLPFADEIERLVAIPKQHQQSQEEISL